MLVFSNCTQFCISLLLHSYLSETSSNMSKKTIVSVELLCSKCRQKVMKLIATIEGITSIVQDPSKNTVTIIGEADPVKIIHKVRKFRKSASIVSIGPPKEETTKKDQDSSKDSSKLDKDSLLKKDVIGGGGGGGGGHHVVPFAPKTCQRCDVWYVVNDDVYGYCSIM